VTTLVFFLDQCVPASVGRRLEEAGYAVTRLAHHMATDSPDKAVIHKAQELDAILVSINGDFADIVAYPPAHYAGILALQVRNHPDALPRLLARLIDYLSAETDRDGYRGTLMIVEPHRIRIRR
jgi:predicted nuclease of predicted toxin-antitoxin system